jgi:hypothetical protein
MTTPAPPPAAQAPMPVFAAPADQQAAPAAAPPVLASPAAAPEAEAVTPDALAQQAVADGAQAQGVSDDAIKAMQKQMAAMQATIDKMNTEKASKFDSDADKYATSVRDQLAAIAAANPQLDLAAGVDLSGQLLDGDDVSGKLRKWVTREQRAHPGLHFGYVLDLLDEHADAADAQAA